MSPMDGASPLSPIPLSPPTPEAGRRHASIQDVAKAAGVSTATVSRVVNNPSLVAADTAARVQRVITDLGYRPNIFAQGLTTRRSHLLGIALPDLHGEFYSELLRGADNEAHRWGYHLIVRSEPRKGGASES
ncbi:MAG: LacI family DNA-binding transcriptional regulator, partial [Phycisphaerales bacterium]|nr:LacI family DNA-binding transcriptional regulator [Phycisphaerales bacterium]